MVIYILFTTTTESNHTSHANVSGNASKADTNNDNTSNSSDANDVIQIVCHEDPIMTWLTKASNQRYSAAQCGLGHPYLRGLSVPQDYDRVMEWCLKAAQHNIGVLFFYRHGVSVDYEAMEWYVKDAKQGYALAQGAIGRLYHKGQGVPQDTIKAVQWFTKAADTGYATAQYTAGILYNHGQGIPVDNTMATQWLLKAGK